MNFLCLRGTELINLDAITRIIALTDHDGTRCYEVYFTGWLHPTYFGGEDAAALAKVLPQPHEKT